MASRRTSQSAPGNATTPSGGQRCAPGWGARGISARQRDKVEGVAEDTQPDDEMSPPGAIDDAELDEEIDESFPASDPPSHWSGARRDNDESAS